MDQADVASTATNAVVLAEDFFRHESGKLVSLLVRLFGAEHVQLAEDVVQEALMRALKTWPYYGVPENPAAWMTMTAKNLAVDAVRRDKIARRKQIDIFGSTHKWSAQVTEADSAELEHGIDDAMLRMMLICCHPSVRGCSAAPRPEDPVRIRHRRDRERLPHLRGRRPQAPDPRERAAARSGRPARASPRRATRRAPRRRVQDHLPPIQRGL